MNIAIVSTFRHITQILHHVYTMKIYLLFVLQQMKGVFLIKNDSDLRSAVSVRPKISLVIWGFVSLFFAIMYLSFTITGIGGEASPAEESVYKAVAIPLSVVLFAVGITCLIIYYKKLKKAKMIESYIGFIGNKKSVPIKWLAQKKNISWEQVMADLYKTMSCGIFTDGYIDEKNDVLLFPNDNSVGTLKIVLCKNCGAGVEIMTGYAGICTYCSTTVSD